MRTAATKPFVTVTLLHADGSRSRGCRAADARCWHGGGIGLTIQQPLTLTDSKGRATGRVTARQLQHRLTPAWRQHGVGTLQKSIVIYFRSGYLTKGLR